MESMEQDIIDKIKENLVQTVNKLRHMCKFFQMDQEDDNFFLPVRGPTESSHQTVQLHNQLGREKKKSQPDDHRPTRGWP